MGTASDRFFSKHWFNLVTAAFVGLATMFTWGQINGKNQETVSHYTSKINDINKRIDTLDTDGSTHSKKNSWEVERLKEHLTKLETENKQLAGIVADIKNQVSVLSIKYENQEKKMDEIIGLLKQKQN